MVGILIVLFMPIPTRLLDLLLIANFSFALLILLITFYAQKPVDFSTFPSLLLIATLFRLSLNIAATRLILSDADAGRVIAAVGSYVVERQLRHRPDRVRDPGGGAVRGGHQRCAARRGGRGALHAGRHAGPADEHRRGPEHGSDRPERGEAPAQEPREGGEFLRRDGRRQQVRQGRRDRRHHHPADQHHRRARDRGRAARHALGRGAADLHAAHHRRRYRHPDPGAGHRGRHRHHHHALGGRRAAERGDLQADHRLSADPHAGADRVARNDGAAGHSCRAGAVPRAGRWGVGIFCVPGPAGCCRGGGRQGERSSGCRRRGRVRAARRGSRWSSRSGRT